MSEGNFFEKNRPFYIIAIVAFFLFMIIIVMEKYRVMEDLIPMLRGEVSLENDIIVTSTRGKNPLLVKKTDPFIGKRLRMSGAVKSIFSETILDMCHSNDVVVEVGAHFGYNSVLLGKKVKDGKVYCLEPNSSIFSYLRKNIIINDLESVCILKNVAISGVKGDCVIEDYFTILGSHNKQNTIHVSCNTLDNEIKERINSVNLLAIDIPGMEFLILSGAAKMLSESADIVVVVTFNKEESSKRVDIAGELKRLHSSGFHFYLAGGSNDISPITIAEILELTNAVLIFSKRLL
ncbi:MAG: FkbM family methyltransferase [Holosporaceae bacterium]|nr:FkbM family methyltransferase [Holosporaceae bacterium]